MVTIVNKIVYLKIVKREDIKSSHQKKIKFVSMCGNECSLDLLW